MSHNAIPVMSYAMNSHYLYSFDNNIITYYYKHYQLLGYNSIVVKYLTKFFITKISQGKSFSSLVTYYLNYHNLTVYTTCAWVTAW